MDRTYDESMTALRSAGIHPYVVNEKSARHGYRRMWSIYIPGGQDRDAETIWVEDDVNRRDKALNRLVERHCTHLDDEDS